jgi:hypothetical protein
MTNNWPLLAALGGLLAALALFRGARGAPIALGGFGQVDALGGFFLVATAGWVALSLLEPRPARLLARRAALAVALALAYCTTLVAAIAGCYLVATLLALTGHPTSLVLPQRREGAEPDDSTAKAAADATTPRWRMLGGALAAAAPSLLAAACLSIGYGALALRGASGYDAPAASFAIDSLAFWFVLLAALLGIGNWQSEMLGWRAWSQPTLADRSPTLPPAEASLLRLAWLYPLARLYSLGPWNTGWSFAAMLFGGAIACWCAISALARPGPRSPASLLGLALASLGLGTSAGVAAMCYAILAYTIGAPAQHIGDRELGIGEVSARSAAPDRQSLFPWLLSTAFPLTAPFVAAWMVIGASVAGGVSVLGGVAWLVALIEGLSAAIARWPARAPRQPLLILAFVSLLLGAGAPLVVLWLIQPVVAQLQGGLTPYGDINIWPWIGLATSDAAHTQVTTLPSIAIALLMLVLCALVYTLARLREPPAPPDASESAADDAPRGVGGADGRRGLLRTLRADVPWLAALLGPERQPERQPGDSE